MPPLAAAAEILASPVAYTRMPQASARPTFGAVAAGPAETGPFMLMVIGAVTGPWPMAAHPLRSAAHVTASIEPFSMGGPPLTVPSPVRPDSGDSKVPARTNLAVSAAFGEMWWPFRQRPHVEVAAAMAS